MRQQIGDRLIDYSVKIIFLVEEIPQKRGTRKLIDQLLSSSWSVGANYEEAQAAESKADFIHKLQVSLKEMRESYYWLRVAKQAQYLKSPDSDVVLKESFELRAILSKAVATAKGKAKR